MPVRFSVTDTGPGIPEDRQDALFTPFTQVDGSTTRRFGGSGLGLAICKQLVEMMGGHIGLVSHLGMGSTFWFVLPLPVIHNDAPLPVGGRRLAGINLLLVEDEVQRRWRLWDSLKAWGCRVEHVSHDDEAQLLAKQQRAHGDPFDIALVDLESRMGNRYRLIHELSYRGELPVVGLGGDRERHESDLLRQLGVRQILHDPVDPQRLYETLASLLPATPTQAAPLHEDHGQTDIPPRQLKGHVLVAEDNPTNQLYVEELLNQFGCTSQVVSSGDRVLQAIRSTRFDLVLMDCLMPGQDGYEITREIRERESAQQQPGRLPIIALTANALSGERERCLLAGMDEYLSKPVEAAQLRTMLEKYLPEQKNQTTVSVNETCLVS